jgi:alkylation response protein AidB-like acyl-CoA dehydrogenase
LDDTLGVIVEKAVEATWGDPGATHFPRSVLESLAHAGVLRRRWAPVAASGSYAGDVMFGLHLDAELSHRAPGGVAIGVSLHTETVLSMLHRFAGDSEYLASLREDALDGRQLGCIAASEPKGGSDLGAVSCLARPTGQGWSISGRKKYVSLGSVADFAIVLCRVAMPAGEPTDHHATIALPLAGVEVVHVHEKLGAHALDTVVMDFDEVEVPEDAVLGRVGLGVLNLNYGLSFERLAIAAQVAGYSGKALSLAVEHATRRTQFGRPLREHQYISFRLAELKAEISVYEAAVRDIGRELMARPLDRDLITRIASVKLMASRAGERLVSTAMQVFGGPGYLTCETPLGQIWNDVRVGRIGAGTDEMMLALIADSLRGDHGLYERLVHISE